MEHGKETGEHDNENEVVDDRVEINSINEGSVESATGIEAAIDLNERLDPLVENVNLDKLIDDAFHELEFATDRKKFSELNIFLPFEVPLSHTVEKKITHGISAAEHERLKELKVKFKKGRFNPEEDQILKRNWESFSAKYGFSDPEPFLPGVTNCLTAIQRKKFVQWLGQGLETRSLNSIYSRFKMLYSDTSKTNRFSELEDKLIKRCLERNVEMPFVLLSKILNRDRLYISKHYRLTQTAAFSSTERVHWNMDLVKQFVEALLKSTGCQEVEQLRFASLPPRVWNSVSEVIQVPASRCRAFWNRKLSTQLFAEEPMTRLQLCTTLLLSFWKHRNKYVYWQDIKWSKVAKQFKGVAPIFLASTFKSFVHGNVPKQKWKSLKACLKFLRKHWLQKLPTIKSTIRLTRLRYINGKLIVLSDK